jgi:hypothetical protein
MFPAQFFYVCLERFPSACFEFRHDFIFAHLNMTGSRFLDDVSSPLRPVEHVWLTAAPQHF